LCLFFGIAVLLNVKKHSSGRTTFQGEDQSHPLYWAASQNTLGSALFALGRMTGSLDALVAAEEAFDGAREVYFTRGADKLAMIAEKNMTRVRQLLPAPKAKPDNVPKSWHEIDDEEEWKKMKGDKNKKE
jgi:hypothetical protein